MRKLFVSNKDESVRMFKKDWMEALSKVHWSTPLIVFVPVVIYCIVKSTAFEYSVIEYIGIFALGFLAWTFTEYIMHRFVFHYEPKSKFGQRIHFIVHGVHHDYPNDSKRLVLPPSVSIPLALGFYFLFKSFIPAHIFFPFFAAFIIGYLCYDELHYAIHHAPFKGKMWNILKTHHLKHHYTDDHKGYGVSSPLWDMIVGSNFDKKPLKQNVQNEVQKTSAVEN